MVVIVNDSLFSMIILSKHVMYNRFIRQNGVLNGSLDQFQKFGHEVPCVLELGMSLQIFKEKKGRLRGEKQSEKNDVLADTC